MLESLGGLENEEVKNETVAALEEKKSKLPWHTWKVGDTEYKLKLSTPNICKLEDKYRCNIASLVMAEGVPPLSVMLTIITSAMSSYQHKVSYQDVQKIYENWTNEGGNQQELYGKVILPIMGVSGFFTESQMQALNQTLEEEMI